MQTELAAAKDDLMQLQGEIKASFAAYLRNWIELTARRYLEIESVRVDRMSHLKLKEFRDAVDRYAANSREIIERQIEGYRAWDSIRHGPIHKPDWWASEQRHRIAEEFQQIVRKAGLNAPSCIELEAPPGLPIQLQRHRALAERVASLESATGQLEHEIARHRVNKRWDELR